MSLLNFARHGEPLSAGTMINEDMSFHYDVVVIGGGAAGVAAAVGAANSGASVCMVEKYGFLGGAATTSSVLTYCGFFDQNKTQVVRGVGQQVLDRLAEKDLNRVHTMAETGNTIVVLDLETTKSVLDDIVTDSAIRLLLHSSVIGARTDGDRITDVDVMHRGGRVRIHGRAFVDASGDGALIAAAGAGSILSAPENRQANTLVMRVGNVDEDADLSEAGMRAAIESYERRTSSAFVRQSGIAVRMPLSREIMLLLADNHADALDVDELTHAEVESRRLSRRYFDAFTDSLSGWQRAYLANTGPQIGIRESRRLRGIDAVSSHDVSTARKRPGDSIGRGGWPMESHVAPGVTDYGRIDGKSWYHIPYGSIRSATTQNLWAGGRLVCSDDRAYASLRVLGTSFATGHAAGVAAAVFAETGEHDYARIRRGLEEQGALL